MSQPTQPRPIVLFVPSGDVGEHFTSICEKCLTLSPYALISPLFKQINKRPALANVTTTTKNSLSSPAKLFHDRKLHDKSLKSLRKCSTRFLFHLLLVQWNCFLSPLSMRFDPDELANIRVGVQITIFLDFSLVAFKTWRMKMRKSEKLAQLKVFCWPAHSGHGRKRPWELSRTSIYHFNFLIFFSCHFLCLLSWVFAISSN